MDWCDNKLQLPRNKLSHTHFLPSEEDAKLGAVCYTVHDGILGGKFKSLQHLSHLVPARNSPHPVQKSSIVPMKILFRDEKYTAETVEIVSHLLDDAKLSGDNP